MSLLRRFFRYVESFAASALGIILLSTAAIAQQPVIPGASGFGITTPAGRGGTIMRVTNLADSGAGSLRACATASGPRICIFETSGTIELQSNLVITNPNITIAGQTAPSPGILLRGGTLHIKASDVLVQHLVVRVGDPLDGEPTSVRDGLGINAPSFIQNIVIDHCSISWGVDEVLQVWNDWDNVTLSNTIISEPLHDSLHSKGPHGFAMLVDTTDGRLSVVGSLIAHSYNRNPRVGAASFVFVNNVIYNYGAGGMALFNAPGVPSSNSIVGNVYKKGPDSSATRTIRLDTSSDGKSNGMLPETRIYLADNVAADGTSDAWSIVDNKSSVDNSVLKAATPPVWPDGLTAIPTSNDAVLNHVLANAGSRPAERDAVDARVMNDVRNGTGQIINCVSADGTERCNKNAGGWPVYAVNARPLSVPANPHGDDNGDGYTNIEEWLHEMAAAVEGSSGSGPSDPDAVKPAPPQLLTQNQ